jgi:hypothetical protein
MGTFTTSIVREDVTDFISYSVRCLKVVPHISQEQMTISLPDIKESTMTYMVRWIIRMVSQN